MTKLITCIALMACCLATPSNARAQDVATEQFVQGKALYNQGKYAVALPLFREALASSESPNARLFVARCLRETGELVEAYRQMRRTLDDASALADSDAKYKATRDAAAAELAKLDRVVGRVVIALKGEVDGATITVNGEPVDDASRPMPVIAGEVVVVASAEGRRPSQQRVSVAAGALETVVLELVRAGVAAPAPNVADEDDEGLGVVRAIGIGVAVLGAGGIALGAATGVMAQGKADELDEACGGARCTDLRYADVVDEGETLRTVANLGFIAGGTLLAAGVAMIIFGGASSDDTVARLSLSPEGIYLGGVF